MTGPGGGWAQPPAGGGWVQPPAGGGWGQPVGAPPPPPPQAAPSGPKTDPLGIASLALGVFCLLSCVCLSFVVIPFAIVGTILGFVSLSNIRSRPEVYRGRELAIAGIALSLLTIALLVAMIVAPIGFAGLLAFLDAGRHR